MTRTTFLPTGWTASAESRTATIRKASAGQQGRVPYRVPSSDGWQRTQWRAVLRPGGCRPTARRERRPHLHAEGHPLPDTGLHEQSSLRHRYRRRRRGAGIQSPDGARLIPLAAGPARRRQTQPFLPPLCGAALRRARQRQRRLRRRRPPDPPERKTPKGGTGRGERFCPLPSQGLGPAALGAGMKPLGEYRGQLWGHGQVLGWPGRVGRENRILLAIVQHS